MCVHTYIYIYIFRCMRVYECVHARAWIYVCMLITFNEVAYMKHVIKFTHLLKFCNTGREHVPREILSGKTHFTCACATVQYNWDSINVVTFAGDGWRLVVGLNMSLLFPRPVDKNNRKMLIRNEKITINGYIHDIILLQELHLPNEQITKLVTNKIHNKTNKSQNRLLRLICIYYSNIGLFHIFLWMVQKKKLYN